MFTTDHEDRRAPRLRGAGAALAATLLLAGCSPAVTSDDSTAVPAASEAPAESSVEWEDIWSGEDVEAIDGVAEDFPAEIPLPDGELVVSSVGEGMWDMIFETADSEAQADQLLAALDPIVAQDEEGETPEGGRYWVLSGDRYAIFVQMQPGPMPPPMVGITVVEQ